MDQRLRDAAPPAGPPGLSRYLASRAASPARYLLEQLPQWLIGWWPGLPGMAGRALAYAPLLGRGSRAPWSEGGVEFFHMDSIFLGKSVYIDRGARLHASRAAIHVGEGCRIMRLACLTTATANAAVGEGITLGPNCRVGVGTVLASGSGGLTLGRNVVVGAGALLVTGDHDFRSTDRPAMEQACIGRPIIIGDDVWIGAGAVILGGVAVGQRSVVSAGAVVSRDVPPGVVVAGVPAVPLAG